MKKVSYIIVIAALLTSCRDDDDTKGIFKLTIESEFNADSHLWLIVRDHYSGDLIGYQEINSRGAMKFGYPKSPTDKIDVTFFRFDDRSSIKYTYIRSYAGVAAGAEWTSKDPSPGEEVPANTGTFNLTVSDLPSLYSIGISDKYGSSSGPLTQLSTSGNTVSVSGKVTVRSNVPTQFISVDPGYGMPKYTIIENTQPSSNVLVSFNALKDFDKVTTLNFPETKSIEAYVIAFDPAPAGIGHRAGYELYNNRVWGYEKKARTSLSLGYLSRFAIYYTAIWIEVPNGKFSYSAIGPPPSSLQFVDPGEFKITNPSLSGFAFETSRDYRTLHVDFTQRSPEQVISLYISSAAGFVKLRQPVPQELLDRFSIRVDNLEADGATFVIGGDDFQKFASGNKTLSGDMAWSDSPFEKMAVSVNR